MVCIYYQYKEYKEGAIRPNAAPDLVNFHIPYFRGQRFGGKHMQFWRCCLSQARKWLRHASHLWDESPSQTLCLGGKMVLKLSPTPSKTDFQLKNRKSRTMSPLVSSKRASLSRICEEESGNQCLSSDRSRDSSLKFIFTFFDFAGRRRRKGGKGGRRTQAWLPILVGRWVRRKKRRGVKRKRRRKRRRKGGRVVLPQQWMRRRRRRNALATSQGFCQRSSTQTEWPLYDQTGEDQIPFPSKLLQLIQLER